MRHGLKHSPSLEREYRPTAEGLARGPGCGGLPRLVSQRWLNSYGKQCFSHDVGGQTRTGDVGRDSKGDISGGCLARDFACPPCGSAALGRIDCSERPEFFEGGSGEFFRSGLSRSPSPPVPLDKPQTNPVTRDNRSRFSRHRTQLIHRLLVSCYGLPGLVERCKAFLAFRDGGFMYI